MIKKKKKGTGEGVVHRVRDELMDCGGGSKVKCPCLGSPRGLPGGGHCLISHKCYYLNWI